MQVTFEHSILIFSCLLFISIWVGKIGYKFGVPTLLLFLLVGMVAGNEGLGIEFDNIVTAQHIGEMALCIILFSGGLDTQYKEIRPIMKQGVILATLGVVLTAFAMGGFIYFVTNNFFPSIQLTFLQSFLLASVMSSTDSASVFSILRSRGLSLKNNLRPLLELESGSNDPTAYLLTIVSISLITGQTVGFLDASFSFILQFVLGVIGGLAIGWLFVRLINKINVHNNALYPVLLLAGALFTFSFTTFVGGNGFMAVYVGGLVIGNHKFVQKRISKDFFDGIAWLMQIVMFLTLGLLVTPSELIPIAGAGLVLAIGLILLARPLPVILCLLPFRKMGVKDKAYVSWVGLRGAVPIIFAILPLAYGVPHAQTMFNIVFFITLVSLLVQGTSLAWVADKLKLSNPSVTRERMKHFDVGFSDDMSPETFEVNICENWLKEGTQIKNLPISENSLVVLVKRDNKYILPKGQTELQVDDKLLILTDTDDENIHELQEMLHINDDCES
ncbi:MAG: potassium/proton antiporter [Bacteroidales bacterium]|nr:potassium/proton antiporter [Bacteroidales bacterium]